MLRKFLLVITLGLLLFVLTNGYKKMSAFAPKDINAEQASYKEVDNNNPESLTSAKSNNPLPSIKEVLTIKEDDIVIGSRDAKITLVEYSSLTCPSCAFFHRKVFPSIKKNYIDRGVITYVLREFAFDKQAFEAAILARCSGPEKFLSFIEVLFESQDNWAYKKEYRDVLLNIAKLGGVSEETFLAALEDTKIINIILSNYNDASKILKLKGTPSFFINKKPYKGNFSYQNLSKVIEDEIKAIDK